MTNNNQKRLSKKLFEVAERLEDVLDDAELADEEAPTDYEYSVILKVRNVVRTLQSYASYLKQ